MANSTERGTIYPCECTVGGARGEYQHHHYICCEVAQRTGDGYGRLVDVVIDRCYHDEPERCPYLGPRGS